MHPKQIVKLSEKAKAAILKTEDGVIQPANGINQAANTQEATICPSKDAESTKGATGAVTKTEDVAVQSTSGPANFQQAMFAKREAKIIVTKPENALHQNAGGINHSGAESEKKLTGNKRKLESSIKTKEELEKDLSSAQSLVEIKKLALAYVEEMRKIMTHTIISNTIRDIREMVDKVTQDTIKNTLPRLQEEAMQVMAKAAEEWVAERKRRRVGDNSNG